MILLAQDAGQLIAERWVEFGIAGLVIVSMMMGWLVPGRIHEREVARGDRLERDNNELRERISQHVIPLVHRAIDAIEHSRVDRYGERHADRDVTGGF